MKEQKKNNNAVENHILLPIKLFQIGNDRNDSKLGMIERYKLKKKN